MGRWGDISNLRQAVSPYPGDEGDMNATFEISTDDGRETYSASIGEFVGERMEGEKDRKLSRSDSSLSDLSDSSTSSVVR